MRVTHAEDHVTHAVIGAGQAQAFAINDSTEFFRILSSSLYSEKKLAVVREILCNAWDAHIEAGRTDTPIKITLDNDVLSIRDFGPGLAPDDILKLYTTYGGTSKISNDNVTGGFGLGSKAPFAYIDHFEVTSCHAGIKTIYNMSLSSAMVDGKPSVMKILDLPTTETGIQVSVNLKSKEDRWQFEQLIQRIVANGEMNAELNGVKQEIITFSQSPHGFTIVSRKDMGSPSQHIHIRYGHVIYPLEVPDHLEKQERLIKEFLMKLDGDSKPGSYGYRDTTPNRVMVIQAPPGSVSVTPSRESLSMTDHTIKSVQELLSGVLKVLQEKMDPYCIEYLKEAIAETVKTKKMSQLFHPKRVLPNKGYFTRLHEKLPKEITNLQDASAYYLANSHYPSSARFFSSDIDIRLTAMIDAGFTGKPLLNSYRAELRRLESPRDHSPWFHRKVLWPLIRDIQEDPKTEMRVANLFVLDQGKDRFGYTKLMPQSVKNFTLTQIRWALPYLRQLVTISHNRQDPLEYGYADSSLSELGSLSGSLLYVVPRNPQKIAKAKAFFTKRGYVINDWTPNQKVEVKPKDPTAPVVAPKPRRSGFPILSNLLVEGRPNSLDLNQLYAEDNKLTETPEFVMLISPNRQSIPDIPGFEHCHSHAIAALFRLFGDKGCAVPSKITQDKLLEKGVVADKDILPWVMTRVLKEFQTNKLIKQHYQNYRAHDVDPPDNLLKLLSIIRKDEKLRRMANLPVPVGQRERDFIAIYESFPDYWALHYDTKEKHLKAIKALIGSWNASSSLKKLLGKISNNRLVDSLDLSRVGGLMQNGTNEQVDKVRKLIIYAMKG